MMQIRIQYRTMLYELPTEDAAELRQRAERMLFNYMASTSCPK